MSDWDTVTKIGTKVRGGDTAQRETVVRGKSALNAAQRQGTVVATQKKQSAGNAAKGVSADGQRHAKVDRSDDIVKPKAVSHGVAQVIIRERNRVGMSQKDLAAKCHTVPSVIAEIERGTGTPDHKILTAIENAFNVRLLGDNVGAQKYPKRAK